MYDLCCWIHLFSWVKDVLTDIGEYLLTITQIPVAILFIV